eukprot:TRINITY_DN33304_c0_g1_i1.p1 TRINITY_DN33304_c0_g1~~TRINITY_DN33304_c0_g1_i1.p1  ORF type:complete len:352 (+),score=88.86 TRINITY_DN33304_c0_g1_i1:80-1057(+)
MGGGASKTESHTKLLCKEAIKGATGVVDKEYRMMQAFEAWDTDRNGTLSRAELQQVFENLGTKVSRGDIDKLLKDADVNKDDAISYQEFVSWLCVAPNLKRYFEVSEEIQRRNTKEAIALSSKLNAQLERDAQRAAGSDPFAAMAAAGAKMAKEMEALQKRSQARIDKELTPIIKKAFAYHDKDGSGVLEYDESIVFFSNYVSLLGPYLESQAELAATQQMDITGIQGPMTSPSNVVQVFRQRFSERKQSYGRNADGHHQAAFRLLDVKNDGKLHESEVVEALLHGHAKNLQLMEALGLLVPPEELMQAAMGDAMEAIAGDCPMQ